MIVCVLGGSGFDYIVSAKCNDDKICIMLNNDLTNV